MSKVTFLCFTSSFSLLFLFPPRCYPTFSSLNSLFFVHPRSEVILPILCLILFKFLCLSFLCFSSRSPDFPLLFLSTLLHFVPQYKCTCFVSVFLLNLHCFALSLSLSVSFARLFILPDKLACLMAHIQQCSIKKLRVTIPFASIASNGRLRLCRSAPV